MLDNIYFILKITPRTTRKTISLFLSFILIAGTITAFYPSSSFTKEVHALSEYELMNDDYNSKYLQYNKENIDCTNLNLNGNGLDINTIPESLSGLAASQGETGDSESGISAYGSTDENRFGSYDSKKDFLYKCINNNDNEFIISPTPSTPPTPPNPPPVPPVPVSNVCTVWQDDTPGNDEIFFSGSRDDGETFSTPLNISRTTEDSKEPQVKCDENNVYVVWEEDTSTGATNEIFFSFSHDGGQTFTTKNISNTPTANSEDAQISVDGNNVYVVWKDRPLGNDDILFARSIDGGLTFSEPDNNISNNPEGSVDPQISSEGNNVYVVWREFLSFPNLFDIFFSFSHDGGQTFSEPDNIGNNPDSASNPQISSEGNNVYVVWENDITTSDTTDIFFSFSHDGGETFSDPFNISENTGDSVNPQISSEGNNVYVVWQDRTPGNTGILFARSTDGGLTFGEPDNNISEDTAFFANPQISLEGNNVYVIWQSDNGDILFARSTDGGLTFGEPDNISEGNTGFSFNPQISSEGNNVYVIWQGSISDNRDIFFSFSNDGGETFSSPPDNISNNAGISRNPQISSTGETQQQSTNNIITTLGNNNEHIIIKNTIPQKDITTQDIVTNKNIIEQEEKQKITLNL